MAYLLSGERSSADITSMPSRRAGLLASIMRHFADLRRRRTQRLALATLLELDDCRLDDLGISRFDVVEAVRDHVRESDGVLARRRAQRAQAWLRSGRSQP